MNNVILALIKKNYMKKLLLSIFTAMSLGSFAQTILLQEDFTAYPAVGPAPVGWYPSYNGNYTTAASSGTSGPNSYKFGVNGATVITPQFAAGNDTLTFWLKGQSTDAISEFYIYESLDSTIWTPLDSINPLPTTGTAQKFALASTSKWLKFVYSKSVGNIAFDDFKVTQYAPLIAPTAAFTSDEPVCPSDSVHFTDATTGNVSTWDWDFGDGVTSTLQNPVHLYPASGNYTVTLIVNAGTSNADTTTGNVLIVSQPSFSMTYANAYINAPTLFYSVVNTLNSTCSVNAYKWTFGDPASGSNDTSALANPTHNYTVAGSYTVRLRVQFSCLVNCSSGMGNGWDSLDLQLTVGANQQIVAQFSAPPACENQCAQLMNAGSHSTYAPINDYAWDFGDGSPVFHGPIPPCHTYPVATTFMASLTVTDDSSHTATTMFPVTVNPMPIVNINASTFTACEQESVCFQPIVTTTMGGPLAVCSYAWDFGDGSFDGTPNPCHVFPAPGIYNVCLTVFTCDGCMGMSCTQITVSPLPTVDFSETDCGALTKCFTDLSIGSIAAWNWTFGDGNLANTQNPTHAYAIDGTYTTKLVVTTTTGCVDSVSKSVIVTPGIGLNKLSNLNSVTVFGTNGTININSTSNLTANITVYALNGEKITSSKMIEEKMISIDMNNYSAGLYLVIISNSEGSVAKKINLMK